MLYLLTGPILHVFKFLVCAVVLYLWIPQESKSHVSRRKIRLCLECSRQLLLIWKSHHSVKLPS